MAGLRVVTRHVLHRLQHRALGGLLRGGQALQQLQQAGAAVPGHVQRQRDVVTAQRADRDDAGHAADAGGLGKGQQRIARGLERSLRVGHGIELVDGKDDAGHPQQMGQQGMAPGLRQQRHRLAGGRALPIDLGDVDQYHGGVAAGGGGDHVAGVLLVAGRVGNDELALAGGEVAVSHVDGDALLALGLQAVGQQRQIHRRTGGAPFQCVQLVGQDGLAVKQQAADQRALAVIHAAGGEKAQRAVVCALCGLAVVAPSPGHGEGWGGG